jgi:hypothetical protein
LITTHWSPQVPTRGRCPQADPLAGVGTFACCQVVSGTPSRTATAAAPIFIRSCAARACRLARRRADACCGVLASAPSFRPMCASRFSENGVGCLTMQQLAVIDMHGLGRAVGRAGAAGRPSSSQNPRDPRCPSPTSKTHRRLGDDPLETNRTMRPRQRRVVAHATATQATLTFAVPALWPRTCGCQPPDNAAVGSPTTG